MNEGNFEKPNMERREDPGALLTKKDQEVLLECGEKIAQHLKKDWSEKLPDYVIYVDTTARPLAYMFDPVWEKIAKERGGEKPKTIFFPTAEGSRDGAQRFLWSTIDKDNFSIEKVKEKINYFDDPKNLLERRDKFRDDHSYECYKNVCTFYETAIQKIEESSKNMSRKPNIAIIDEYMASGHSIAFLEFLFANYVNEQKSYVLGRSSMSPMWSGLKKNIRVGAIDDKPDYYNKERKSFQMEYPIKNRDAKGVLKPTALSVFSSVDPNRDIEAVKKIRKEMREIGKKISKKI